MSHHEILMTHVELCVRRRRVELRGFQLTRAGFARNSTHSHAHLRREPSQIATGELVTGQMDFSGAKSPEEGPVHRDGREWARPSLGERKQHIKTMAADNPLVRARVSKRFN